MNLPGHLIERHGPMFSSKTSFLRDNLNRYADLGFPVAYINTVKDTRSNDGISTNSSGGISLSPRVDKFSLNDLSDFDPKKFKVIGTDEIQFFDNCSDIILEWVDLMDKIVYVVGLDLNAKREKWGSILDLAGHAEDSQKLTAKCVDCLSEGRGIIEAPFTSKLDVSGPIIDIGGSDKYIPVCRQHWNKRNKN